MKITIRKKEPKRKTITAADVKPGYVFEYCEDFSDSEGRVVALKLHNGIVYLKFDDKKDWFKIRDDASWKNCSVKILGRLSEIIVEEE